MVPVLPGAKMGKLEENMGKKLGTVLHPPGRRSLDEFLRKRTSPIAGMITWFGRGQTFA